MRNRHTIAALALFLLPVGCKTIEITTYTAGAQKDATIGVRGNVNLAGTGDTTDANRIGGLGILNGGSPGVDQVRRTATEPVTDALNGSQSTLVLERPDGTKIAFHGTVDQASTIRERWIGIRGLAKSIATTVLGSKLIGGHYDTQQAEIAAEKAKALGSQGVETEALRQATAQATIANEVPLAEIAAGAAP